MREETEFERKMSSAELEYANIIQQVPRIGHAISENDPFKLMQELAELNRYIKAAMMETIAAQEEYLKPIKMEAQRIA